MINFDHPELFYSDHTHKEYTIIIEDVGTLTNEDLYEEDVTIHEMLCSEEQLRFGACEASYISFKTSVETVPLIGKKIEVYMTIESEDPISIGTYTTVSDSPTADRSARVVTAYDSMYDIINADMLSWWNGLPDSFTVKILRDAFFLHFGITQETISLDNDSLIIQKAELKSVTGLEILSAICEINGCFGHIGRDNKMHYLFLREVIEGLYPAIDLFPADDLYPRVERVGFTFEKAQYSKAVYEDYYVQHIDKINVYTRNNQKVASQGTGTNVYNITDNVLVEGMDAATAKAMVETVYSAIASVWYMPCTVECMGTPVVEVGDSLRLNTSDKVIYMYILERTLKGVQILKDTYICDGAEYRVDDMNSLANQVNAVAEQAKKTAADLKTTNTNVTTAQETADSAGSTASKAKSSADAANNAITAVSARVTTIEGDYIKAKDLTAINASITNLNTAVANFGNVYATQASVKTLVANSVNSYFAGLKSLVVSGNISCHQITMGGTSMTKQQCTVRLANGGTRVLTYIGF